MISTIHYPTRAAHARFLQIVAWIIVPLLTLGFSAHAGVSGVEWQPLYAKVLGMLQGWGGKFIALAAFGWGLFSIFGRGSLTHGLVSEGISIAVFILPSILDNFMTAVI
ncbi:hypothetical protein WT83_27175 [Burkholderia territorii]|uniref:Uncharacterized protein n=1 Tax=Burkholderia territorii TaxID=1503055 RepID=A0A108E7Z1_9BURK|nr:hypothetical protein [Burkholderia territorii]KWN06368.1 hypothetical protein WT83_27175 [Burkholderia territorii]